MNNKILYSGAAWAMCLALVSCSQKIPEQIQTISTSLVSQDLENIKKFSVFAECEFITDEMLEKILEDSECPVSDLYNCGSDISEIKLNDNVYTVYLNDGTNIILNTETYMGKSVWNIEDSILYNSTFSVLTGSEITINDVSVDDSYITDSDEALTTYTIPILPNIDNKLIITNKIFDTVSTVWNEDSCNSGLVSFGVDEKEKTKILNNIKDYTESFYAQLETLESVSESVEYMFSSDNKKTYIEDIFNKGKNMLKTDNIYTKYYQLEVENIEFISEPTFIDSSTLSTKIHIVSRWLIGDGSLKGRTENYPTIQLIKEDSKWVIKNIDDMSYLINLNYLAEVDE